MITSTTIIMNLLIKQRKANVANRPCRNHPKFPTSAFGLQCTSDSSNIRLSIVVHAQSSVKYLTSEKHLRPCIYQKTIIIGRRADKCKSLECRNVKNMTHTIINRSFSLGFLIIRKLTTIYRGRLI